jgi:hypothetical protein
LVFIGIFITPDDPCFVEAGVAFGQVADDVARMARVAAQANERHW